MLYIEYLSMNWQNADEHPYSGWLKYLVPAPNLIIAGIVKPRLMMTPLRKSTFIKKKKNTVS